MRATPKPIAKQSASDRSMGSAWYYGCSSRKLEAAASEVEESAPTFGAEVWGGGIPPRVGIQRIQVVTISLDDSGLDPRSTWYPTLSKNLGRAHVDKFPDQPIAVFLDSRKFNDRRGPRKHSGLHQRACRLFYDQQRQLRDFFSKIQQWMDGEENTWPSDTVCRIGVVCKAGINRSVSGTCILHHMLGMSGFQMLDSIYNSKSKWAERGFCDGGCWECSEDNREKKATMRRCFEMWQKIHAD